MDGLWTTPKVVFAARRWLSQAHVRTAELLTVGFVFRDETLAQQTSDRLIDIWVKANIAAFFGWDCLLYNI